jgi:hypothetical protein
MTENASQMVSNSVLISGFRAKSTNDGPLNNYRYTFTTNDQLCQYVETNHDYCRITAEVEVIKGCVSRVSADRTRLISIWIRSWLWSKRSLKGNVK